MLGVAPGVEEQGVLYSHAFETVADLDGWPANGRLKLRGDAPRGGGARSAYISGGCVWPHSAHAFLASESGAVMLRAWGKSLTRLGGSVTLTNETTDERITVRIEKESWKRVRSGKALAVSEGDVLQIYMGAGGIAASAMLVEEVAVVRAD
jgi:hypothetical protein